MTKKLISIIILASFAVGCSTVRVPAKVTHPAEVNMTNHKKIAIMDIDGNYGDQLRDTIKSRLSASGQFDVQNCASNIRMVETTEEVEVKVKKTKLKSDLDKAVALVNLFNTGEVNIPSDHDTEKRTVTKKVAIRELPEACKPENLRVSAIIKGKYNGKYETNIETTEAVCKDKNNKEYRCDTYTRKASVTTQGSIDVIDANSGRIIATKQLNDTCEKSTWKSRKKPAKIPEQELKNQCVSRNATHFARTIVPWTETVMVAYQKDSDLPQLEQGIKLVTLGRNEEAIEIFSNAITDAKRKMLKPKIIAKAYWNLGLAYEYTWDFQNAVDAFNKGYLLHDDNKFLTEISNTNHMKKQREKLLAQSEKQMFVSDQ